MRFFEKSRADLCRDLNTSAALGNLFSSLKKLNANPPEEKDALIALSELATLLAALGIEPEFTASSSDSEIPEEIQKLAEERWKAKQSRDWPTADQIRNDLLEKGWKILDSKNGYDVEPK